MLNIITDCYILPFIKKTKISQTAPDQDLSIRGPSKALASCIQSLLIKHTIQRVDKEISLGFYNCLFLVPKPQQKQRPVIELGRLNTFLKVEKFKMKTQESIRASPIPGECFASINPSDAYLYIPTSRKFLHSPTGLKITSSNLPFGLATAPQVFAKIVNEVKLMTLSRGI